MPNRGKNRKNDLCVAEERRERVAALYLAGKSQSVIAGLVGASQPTVSNDLAALRERWRANAECDFDAKLAEELAKLDHLEAEAWAGWYRSCEDAETKVTKMEKALKPPKVKKGSSSAEAAAGRSAVLIPVKVVTETTTKGQVGDVRFLIEVREIVIARLKLLGAFPKEQHNTNVNVATFPWDQLAGRVTNEDCPIEAELRAMEGRPSPPRAATATRPE